jgi:S1-C subfamily serine protease
VGLVSVATCDAAYTGTGFLVTPTTLVTAAHVVAGATGVQVAFDNTQVAASVVGVDPSLDLAVLSIPPTSDTRHVFDLAASDPDTGTQIAVVGYPLDEPKSLTEGTISGTGRTITTESGTFDGLLQTDAAINPGNSGGPLVNNAGQIVGVADAIRKDAEGIGFAIPISRARAAIQSGAGLRTLPAPRCGRAPSTKYPVTLDVQQTLSAYLAAINAGRYREAMSLVSGTIRAEASRSQWRTNYSTTYDDQLAIESLQAGSSTAMVWATFRSRQAPGYGPTGATDATCLLWSIDYTMVRQGSTWIIDGVKGHQDPPWVRCD